MLVSELLILLRIVFMSMKDATEYTTQKNTAKQFKASLQYMYCFH